MSHASKDEADIYLVARENNRRNGIAGFLHHEGDYWGQYSEGPSAAIDAMVRKVRSDWRHRDLRVVACPQAKEPLFETFVMALMHHDVVSFAIYQWERGRSESQMCDALAEHLIEYFVYTSKTPQMNRY